MSQLTLQCGHFRTQVVEKLLPEPAGWTAYTVCLDCKQEVINQVKEQI